MEQKNNIDTPTRVSKSKFFRFLLLLVAFSIAILSFVPSLLSTGWGQKQLIDSINKHISGKVEWNQLSLNWFGKQSIEGFSLSDAHGNKIVSLDNFTLETPLFSLLLSKKLPEKGSIDNLNVQLEPFKDGTTNIERSLAFQNTPNESLKLTPIQLSNINSTFNFSPNGKLQITGNTHYKSLNGTISLEASVVDFASGALNFSSSMENFPVSLLDEILTINNPHLKGFFIAALGDTLAINVHQTNEQGDSHFQISSNSSQLKAHLEGYLKEGKLHLQSIQNITLNIEPELVSTLEQIAGKDKEYLALLEPTQLSFNLSHLSIPLSNPLDLSPVALECVLNLSGKNNANHLTMEISGRPGDPTFSANLSARSEQKGQPLVFNFHTTFPKAANFEKLIQTAIHQLKINGDIAGIPLKAVDRLLGLDDFLFKTFGPYANLKIKSGPIAKGASVTIALETQRAPPAHLKLTIESIDKVMEWQNLLLFQAKGVLEIESLAYLKDVRALWEIDGPANRIDMTLDAHTVYENGRVRGRLQLNNWQNGKEIHLDQALVKANFDINQLILDHITIEKLNAKFEARELAKEVEFSLQGTTLDSKRQKNTLYLDGTYVVKDGEASAITLNSQLQQLPTSLIGLLPGIDQNLKATLEIVFGSQLSIDFMAKMQGNDGPIKATVKGANGEVSLDGSVHQGTLTLNTPLVGAFQVTPQLSRLFSQSSIPFLGEIVSADDMIRITVNPENLYLPLNKIDLLNSRIPLATIEMGRLHLRNDGQLAKVLSSLRVSQNDLISVWCTPLFLRINQGNILVERVDMLVGNSYPLAAWGNVDLIRQWVDMKIGLSGAAIAQAFDVLVSDSSTMLQINLRGPLDHPNLDKTKVMAKIGALAAKNQGPHGLLIGSVLQIATGLDDEKTPPPTTTPLPWAHVYDSQTTAEGAKQDYQQFKPIKQIEKSAGNLIKSLFK